VVVSVEPDTFALVEPGLDRLRVRFNERISEQATGGTLASAVEISPEVPELRVEHDRRGLDIHIPGGLRPGITYRVRVSPAIRDMFNNPMAVPFEWVFSTGGDFTQNAVVGQVWDRATGEFIEGVRVVLEPDGAGPDSLLFASRSGDQGLFALRSLPAGSFGVTALLDRNSNREPDGSEAIGQDEVEALGPADTVFLSVSILVPDTTAALLARADALDSLSLQLTFDDFVDPTVPLDDVSFRLAPMPADSMGVLPPQPDGPLPQPERVFHAGEWEIYEDSLRAVADSLARVAADSAAAAGGGGVPDPAAGEPPPDPTGELPSADSLAGPPPGPGIQVPRGIPAGPGGSQPSEVRVLPDGTPIPDPTVVLLLDGPLPPGIEIEVTVEGITNLNGLDGGGGSRGVTWTPPAPDTIPVDSLPADSTGLPPDTAGLDPDTAGLEPDTVGLVPDTVGRNRGNRRTDPAAAALRPRPLP
jgi:hypothetical protein